MSTVVYQTSTETATQRRTRIAGINRVHNAPIYVSTGVYGLCTCCGALEVLLVEVTGTRDFSHIGESAKYPTGYGCELCS